MQDEREHSSNTHEQFSNAEPSTLVPVASSDETARESTTTSSTRSTLPKGMDLESLSPRAEAIKLLLADEMSDGFNLNTLAKELGLSPSWASALLEELKAELELQTGPVPPLSNEEFEVLKESIQKDGVRVPIIIGEHSLIDGRHRWRASVELGLKEIPAVFVTGLTADQERETCIQVNAIRRQLSREQKRALVRAELRRDPSRSSRYIASLCGLTHPTVEVIRKEMAKEAQTEPSAHEVEAQRSFVQEAVDDQEKVVEMRVGLDKKLRAVSVREPQEPVEKPLGFVTCGRCNQRHVLVKDGSTYRLETV